MYLPVYTDTTDDSTGLQAPLAHRHNHYPG